MFGALGLTSAALIVAATALASAPAHAAEGDIRGAGAKDAVQGSYIVVLKDGVSTQSSTVAKRYNAKVTHTYKTALRGYAAKMSEAQAKRTAADPAVDYVEQDRAVRAFDTQIPVPSWGLDRIDQRDLPLDNSYTYPNGGAGVTAYIIDSGIRTSHSDFGGRATWGTNTVDSNNTDCSGHGTHVAGTVGGTSYGVAKGVPLVAVKVLDCQGSGTLAGITAGVDWVTQHHTSGPAVANMSLGAQGSFPTLEDAVRNSIADGITYAIASGNSDFNACNFSPARVAEAITVNASTNTDARASFSNFGTCTDIFAPGQEITSAWNTSDTATNTISGTSMAAPHVAGGAALYLSANPDAGPAQVQTALKDNATKDKITNPGAGSPNNLLYVGFIGGGDPPPPPPPSQAGFTSGSEDGYVKANSDGSRAVVGSAGLGLGIGRGVDGKHNRAVLSFDTSSLPDDAVVTNAYVTVNLNSAWGDPWANPSGNTLKIDADTGCLGSSCSTGVDDWSATPTASGVGTIGKWTSGSRDSTGFNQAGLDALNLTGTTQLRLGFAQFPTSTAYVIIGEENAKLVVEYEQS